MKYCGEELFSELPGRHILWRRIDHQAVCSALPLCSSNLIDFDCDIAQTAFGVVISSSFFLPFFPSVLLRPGFRSTSRTNQNKERRSRAYRRRNNISQLARPQIGLPPTFSRPTTLQMLFVFYFSPVSGLLYFHLHSSGIPGN